MFNQIPIMRFASRLMTTSIIILSLVRGAVAQQGVATDLDSELSKFAQRVLKLLDEQEQPNITIGTITGTGRGSIPGGPGIAAKLASALEQGKKDVISDTAIWSIEGRMLFGDPNANGKLNGAKASTAELSLTVFFTLINQGTQAKVEDRIIITKLTQAPFLLGTTFQTSPEADIKESRKDFVESLNLAPSLDPKHKSRIRPKADTPFALELRAKPIGAEAQGGIPVDARIENRPGIITTQKQPFAFAPIARNQEYEVVIYNDSPDAIAAAISIDGIDVFTFSEDVNPETQKSIFTHFMIPAHSEFVLPGWHKTIDNKRKDNFIAFLVTKYGKGARSRFFPEKAADGTVGAVTVGISKIVKPGGSKSPRAETGFGRPIQQEQNPVELTIEPPHVFITARYDR